MASSQEYDEAVATAAPIIGLLFGADYALSLAGRTTSARARLRALAGLVNALAAARLSVELEKTVNTLTAVLEKAPLYIIAAEASALAYAIRRLVLEDYVEYGVAVVEKVSRLSRGHATHLLLRFIQAAPAKGYSPRHVADTLERHGLLDEDTARIIAVQASLKNARDPANPTALVIQAAQLLQELRA